MAAKFLTGIDLQSQRAINAADGSSPTDLVTLQQLQASQRGLDWKPSVRAATTTNITLSAPQTVDGVALIAGNEVLVKNQTTASENGIYVVAAGAWTRRTDADSDEEVTSGLTVTVTEGTTKGTGTSQANPVAWTLSTADPIVLDTTALTFVVAGGGSTIYSAGDGLNLVGSTFNVVPGNGILADGTSTRVDPTVVVRKFSTNIGNGSLTTFTTAHGLGTADVTVAVKQVSNGEHVYPDITSDATNVVLTFATAPASNAYRLIVHG